MNRPPSRDDARELSHARAHAHAHAGLAHDLSVLARRVPRRRLLGWLAGTGVVGAATMVGCGGGGDASSTSDTSTSSGTSTPTDGSTTTTGSTTTSVSSCSVIPEETAGPYPADGSNTSSGSTSDALMLSGIVRSDIRSSVAGATGIAEGVPLTLTLHLVNTNGACTDLSGYAIYLWHCTRDGQYSLYSSGVTGENFLRGVQVTDATGLATFTTVFPGCYPGRMPHIHFEVYRTATTATSYSNALRTSQLAFPVDVCQTVYNNATGYSASIANLAAISFATDMVFSDGVGTQLATVSGSVSAGYTASLVVGISI